MTSIQNREEVATATAGASVTERFHADKSAFDAVPATPPARVDLLVGEVSPPCTTPSATTDSATTSTTHSRPGDRRGPRRCMALIPRRLVRTRRRRSSHRPPPRQQGQHRRSLLRAGRPRVRCDGSLSDARRRTRMPPAWSGTTTSTDGTPLAGKIEVWHADIDGDHSQFASGSARMEPAGLLLNRRRRPIPPRHNSPGSM